MGDKQGEVTELVEWVKRGETHIVENPPRIISRKPVDNRNFLKEIVC